MSKNNKKIQQEIETLESIFGPEVFSVEKDSALSGKGAPKLLKLKLTEKDSVSLILPAGYPSDAMPILVRATKGSKQMTASVYDQMDAKLEEIFEYSGEGQLYEFFQWYTLFHSSFISSIYLYQYISPGP